MCGGPKGQSQQNQVSTYTPTPQATAAITGALNQAQTTAQLPFNVPQAPVAGFSPDQLTAFNTINNAQGMANPYFTQASNLFNQSTTPNINQFFNPLAGQVGASMQDLFGQQASQNTGQLTQAAGGVGADRIAVGQSELAKQQGLAYGQTMAGLYQPALGAAQQEQNILQSAAYGVGALGPAAQNAVIQGAQAQLGTGGLQQQLSQAQLNAPYQLKLAQAQFPFQESNFLTSAVGALAPGLGGTTNAAGNATPAAPSMWSQILGAGTAAAGIYGGLGGFSGQGMTFPGTSQASDSLNDYTQDVANGDAGSLSQYPGLTMGQARGGRIGYDDGGSVYSGFSGGASDEPVNIASHPFVPQAQLHPIQPHIPQANLNQQSSSSSSGPSLGDIAGDALKIGMMFANRGGSVPSEDMKKFDGFDPRSFFDKRYARGGYADGGSPDDLYTGTPYTNRDVGTEMLRLGMGSRAPDSIPGGEPPPAPFVYRDIDNPDQAMAAWRSGVNGDTSAGQTAQATNGLPSVITQGPPGDQAPATRALSFAPASNTPTRTSAAPEAPDDHPFVHVSDDSGEYDLGDAPGHSHSQDGFMQSPWAALVSAGLGMMAGTSPWAGVNIGQGGLKGMQALEQQQQQRLKEETTEQGARRLELEAKHYSDAERHQQWEESKPVPAGQVFDPQTGLNRTQFMVPSGKNPDGTINWKPVAGAPVTDAGGEPVKGVAAQIGDGIISGTQPPVMTGLGRMTPQVRAYLQSHGFDLSKAQMEWTRGQKQIQALNGPQMTRGYNLYQSVNSTIDRVQELSNQLQLSGVPLLNRAQLTRVMQMEGNSDKGQLVSKYIGAVNTLKEEFANLANGGYAPTEPAWKLADEQINGEYGVKQLGAALGEVKRLIGYRMKFIAESPVGPGAANRYTGQQAPPPTATEPPATTAMPAAHPPNAVGTKTDVSGVKWYVDKDGNVISKAQ